MDNGAENEVLHANIMAMGLLGVLVVCFVVASIITIVLAKGVTKKKNLKLVAFVDYNFCVDFYYLR